MKSEKIKDLEKANRQMMGEKDKNESMQRQMQEMQEKLKNSMIDRDMIE